MIEIKGKINTAICFAKVVEDEAIEQIRREAEPITEEAAGNIRALTESVPIRSRLHWIFSFGGTKKE